MSCFLGFNDARHGWLGICAYSDKEKKIQNASLILKKPIDLDLLLKTAFVFCKHGKKENDTTSENEK
jgi:hypothetical protein